MTTHFLWSIPYLIYNSYLRLLIWGRKRLMNFVLICWLFFYSFFHVMQWNLGCSTFLIPSFPGLYPMVSVSLAWQPKGTATDQKKSDGGGRENQKTKIWARENVPPKLLCNVKPKEKIHAWTKTNQATMASGEVKMAAKHYTRLLNFSR